MNRLNIRVRQFFSNRVMSEKKLCGSSISVYFDAYGSDLSEEFMCEFTTNSEGSKLKACLHP